MCGSFPYLQLSVGVLSLVANTDAAIGIMNAVLLLIALSVAVTAQSDLPVQVHIAVGTNPGDVTFAWSSRTLVAAPQVLIENGLGLNATATLLPADGNNWFVYKAMATGLTPGNEYRYTVGDASAGVSPTYTFQVPPQAGPTSYIIIGDMSTSSEFGLPTWQAVNTYVESQPVDAIFHVGDIAYDLCTNNNTNGDLFMQDIQSQAASVPYMAMPGNHEYTDEFQNYITRFNYAGGTENFYYTFTSGYARFVVFTTEFWFQEYSTLIDPQLAWLSETLTRTPEDIASYPWLIVMSHRPLYCIQKPGDPDCGEGAYTLQAAFEDLLYESKVDLYINGHVHSYQRSTPVYQNETTTFGSDNVYTNPGAPIYLTDGGSGCDEGNSKVHVKFSTPWYVTGTNEYSFGVLSVLNQTYLQYQQYTVGPTAVFDQFAIVKDGQAISY